MRKEMTLEALADAMIAAAASCDADRNTLSLSRGNWDVTVSVKSVKK